MSSFPLAYFITFSCYGHRLHGEEPYSVDRHHSGYGRPAVGANHGRVLFEHELMKADAYILPTDAQIIVLSAIREVCVHKNWTLIACHVRSNHVHSVVHADQRPERVMNAFKSYASRSLNARGQTNVRRWARHGSTKYLWDEKEVDAAVEYVVNGQGVQTALYVATSVIRGEISDKSS